MKRLIIIALFLFACETHNSVSPVENKTTISWNVDYPYSDSLDLAGTNVKVWNLRLIVNNDTVRYPDSYTIEIVDTLSFITIFYFGYEIKGKYQFGESYREYDIKNPGKNVYITQIY